MVAAAPAVKRARHGVESGIGIKRCESKGETASQEQNPGSLASANREDREVRKRLQL